MDFKLIAVLEHTQDLDYESCLVLSKDLAATPRSLAEFIGGRGRFSDGYASAERDVEIGAASERAHAIEVRFAGGGSWIVSGRGILTKGDALDVSSTKGAERLIVRFVGTM